MRIVDAEAVVEDESVNGGGETLLDLSSTSESSSKVVATVLDSLDSQR